MCEKNNSSSFVNGAVLGALVGAVFGILVAPASGNETRRKLRDASDEYVKVGKDLYDEAAETLEDVKIAARPFVEGLEEKLAPILEEARKASTPVRNEVVGKIEQLVDMVEDKHNLKRKFFRGLKR